MLRKKDKTTKYRWMTRTKAVLLISGLVAVLLGFLFYGLGTKKADSFQDLKEAVRWGGEDRFSQIAAYFSVDSNVDPMNFTTYEHGLDSRLDESGILKDEENPQARRYTDAYAATGTISLTFEKKTISVSAIGTGGDFFLFHPVEMIRGSYYYPDDINQDYVIMDELTAWQLFGSSDIEGQMITIGNVPLIVRGVYRQQEGKLAKAAGLENPIVFVPYEVLTSYGTSFGLSSYEIVMPNPVKEFAYNDVKKYLGGDEQRTQVIDNTGRFGFFKRLQVIRDYGKRSMNAKAIIYPYWENISRGLEDQVAIRTFVALIFWVYAIVLFGIMFVYWFKTKGFSFWDVFRKIFKEKIPDGFSKLFRKIKGSLKKKKAAPEEGSEEGSAEPKKKPSKKEKRSSKPKKRKDEAEETPSEDGGTASPEEIKDEGGENYEKDNA